MEKLNSKEWAKIYSRCEVSGVFDSCLCVCVFVSVWVGGGVYGGVRAKTDV